MIRTVLRRDLGRVTSVVMAGLMAGLTVPLPVPKLVGAAHAAVGPGPKVYVFPFQPVFKGVPKEIATQTTDLLKNEIKHSEEVRLQQGPIFIPETAATEIKPLSDKELRSAGDLQKQGESHYRKLRFDKAIGAFKEALSKYEVSLLLLGDITPVLDSLLMLSVCYYRQDQEDEGAKMLVKVIRLKPDLVLDPTKYPPMFRNTAEAIRLQLLRKRRGELEVVANQSGATVFFDGRQVGSTPILLKELVPGEHFVRVEKEGLQSWSDKVTVVSTQRRRVLAVLGGVMKATGPLGEIAESLRANQVTSDVAGMIQAQGKKTGADFVVFGGVAKVSGNYRVGSFLLKVANRELCPLPQIQFDPDLLGASVEVYNMASMMYKRVEGCPSPISSKLVAVIQTAAQEEEIQSVAVGPPKPVALPTSSPAAPIREASPAPELAVTGDPAVASGRGPAVPRAPARAERGPTMPAVPMAAPVVVTTQEGLVTAGPSAIVQPGELPLIPRAPLVEVRKPIDEVEGAGSGSKWYASWWFWTLVGAVVAGGAASTMYFTGVFSGEVGASVTVRWPRP